MGEPLRITVYRNPTAGGVGGVTGATPEQAALQRQQGWNPFNMFQLSMPNLGFNINPFLIFAAIAIIGLLLMKGKRK